MALRKEVIKLLQIYKEHNNIIIGVDFDDTIFAIDPDNKKRCESLRLLLKECKAFSIICLYTVADPISLQYKIALMKEWGLTPDCINEGPLDHKWGNPKKPFFNLLLDDKSGLNETIKILQEFNLAL
jgi:hypothetical protein